MCSPSSDTIIASTRSCFSAERARRYSSSSKLTNSSAVREIPARLAASRIAAAVAKTAGTVTGAEFDVINYPDAHHGFDQERKTIRYKGHTLAYSAEATSDSRKRVREFFLRHLTEELKAKAPVSSN